MNKKDDKIPKLGKKGVFEITDKSWLTKNDNYSDKEEFSYNDLDIKNAPDLSKEEFYKYLAEERVLRQQMRKIDVYDKNAEELAQLFQDNNLVDILNQWVIIHMRNKAIQIKMGMDVLIVPTTQILLKANQILQTKSDIK